MAAELNTSGKYRFIYWYSIVRQCHHNISLSMILRNILHHFVERGEASLEIR